MRVTILEIYNAVWSKTLKDLGEAWKVDPLELGKLCDKHLIPRPKPGYWTQIKLNPNLNPSGMPVEIDINKMIDLAPVKKKPAKKSLVSVCPQTVIKVPKSLHNPHKLTQVARSIYCKPTMKYERLMWSPNTDETFKISVSPDSFNRALRIMDTLIKEFERRDWQFEVACDYYGKYRENTVYLDGNRLTFKLRERLKQTKRKLTDKERIEKLRTGYVYHEKVNEPTGELVLMLQQPLKFTKTPTLTDSLEFRLEEKIGFFFDWLYEASELVTARKVEALKNEALRAERAEYDKQFNSLVSAEQVKIQSLFTTAEQWQKAEMSRQFVDAIQNKLLETGKLTPTQKSWIDWANKIIDLTDPMQKVIKDADTEVMLDELAEHISAVAIGEHFGKNAMDLPPQITRETYEHALNQRKRFQN